MLVCLFVVCLVWWVGLFVVWGGLLCIEWLGVLLFVDLDWFCWGGDLCVFVDAGRWVGWFRVVVWVVVCILCVGWVWKLGGYVGFVWVVCLGLGWVFLAGGC